MRDCTRGAQSVADTASSSWSLGLDLYGGKFKAAADSHARRSLKSIVRRSLSRRSSSPSRVTTTSASPARGPAPTRSAAACIAPPAFPAYRYVDWLLTVPLLLIEAVAVLALAKNVSSGIAARLGIAAVFMIALGYPGEISTDAATRLLWGTLSTVPFL